MGPGRILVTLSEKSFSIVLSPNPLLYAYLMDESTTL